MFRDQCAATNAQLVDRNECAQAFGNSRSSQTPGQSAQKQDACHEELVQLSASDELDWKLY